MGPSPILSANHTVTIDTMLNFIGDNGLGLKNVTWKQTFSKSRHGILRSLQSQMIIISQMVIQLSSRRNCLVLFYVHILNMTRTFVKHGVFLSAAQCLPAERPLFRRRCLSRCCPAPPACSGPEPPWEASGDRLPDPDELVQPSRWDRLKKIGKWRNKETKSQTTWYRSSNKAIWEFSVFITFQQNMSYWTTTL